jgi:predicted nucleic acid-binding protein
VKAELVYPDSSALEKLVVREMESEALRAWVAAHPGAVTSALVVTDEASRLAPAELRTLDAIHIASALSPGADLLAFVTYDDRQRDAPRKAGLPLVQPGGVTDAA